MTVLIIKLGASGDVVRTTPLLHVLPGEVHWLTDDRNFPLLDGIDKLAMPVRWSDRERLMGNRYDLAINLEDSIAAAEVLCSISYDQLFGAYLDGQGNLAYTENASGWFDLSLISRFGKERADQLKLENRKTYQEMVFRGLGYVFTDQQYILPKATPTDLLGDVAIAPNAGAVWPMKNWAYFGELKSELEAQGLRVNYLPTRKTLLEHLGDVQNHRYLVGGDTLPMHLAIGSRIKCLSIFICTSPWEIHGYGLQRKIISPQLGNFFYRRDVNPAASTSIPMALVLGEILSDVGGQAGTLVPF
jgi:heptosyltransferase-2